jgi:hypothetical protein
MWESLLNISLVCFKPNRIVVSAYLVLSNPNLDFSTVKIGQEVAEDAHTHF